MYQYLGRPFHRHHDLRRSDRDQPKALKVKLEFKTCEAAKTRLEARRKLDGKEPMPWGLGQVL